MATCRLGRQYGVLPGGHVAGSSKPASKLLAIPLYPGQADSVDIGRAVVVQADGLGDGPLVNATHLLQEFADRVLVPVLRIGVALDLLVMSDAIAA